MKGKRENTNDDNSGPEAKRNRRFEDQVRLLIPSTIAGAVIGKGGQHIQRMRTQYKATVTVDDSQGPERTILISTDLDSTLQIITEMLKYFEERDDEYDVRLLIHQSLAGCVIGKAGQKIKEIRDKIGCRILKVFSNVAPQSTDRVVQTVGKQTQVIDAVREVILLTRETPIKGPIHNYDPVNFDRMYADEYGGYGGGAGSQRPSRGGGGNRFGGGGGGGGNDRNRNDRSRSGGRRENPFINPWANDDGFGGNNNGGFGGNFGGGFGGNFGGNGGGGGFGNGPVGNNFGNTGGFGGPVGQGNFGGNPGGGFGGGLNQGGGGGVGFGGNANPQVGGGAGFGGAALNAAGNNSGFGGPNNLGNGANNNNATGGGSSGAGFQTGGNNGNAPANLPNGHDPKNSTQVTIPKDLAGAIIGKGGGRIRRIRNDSGAYITIDEPLPGSTDRIITISGNPKQIQMAQYLLQQSVHENNGRRNF